MTAFLWLLLSFGFWLLKSLFLVGWFTTKWAAWSLWPLGALMAVLGGLCGLGCRQANAGWLDWFGRDTSTLEDANRVLQAAAETANDAVRLQADQNIGIAEALATISTAHAQVADQLGDLGMLAVRDSQWAAAISTLGPVLVVVAVLALGALALWSAGRSGAGDTALATVLLENVTSERGRLTLGLLAGETAEPDAPPPENLHEHDATDPADEGAPF